MAINNYIPEYILDNLPWSKRDGLMTHLDKIKCDEKHFREKIYKFIIYIYKSIRGEKISEADLKSYQI